jgi:hypothetical protein
MFAKDWAKDYTKNHYPGSRQAGWLPRIMPRILIEETKPTWIIGKDYAEDTAKIPCPKFLAELGICQDSLPKRPNPTEYLARIAPRNLPRILPWIITQDLALETIRQGSYSESLLKI